jgi:recombination protein RecR
MKLVKNLNLPINYLFRSFGTYGYLCAMQFPSKLIEDAVNAFATLPGIGKKTALRLVMHLLQKEANDTKNLSEAILKMRMEIKFCKTCHNVSDEDICSICSNSYRDKSVVCIVENFRDIIAIENTRHYNGLYHVLEGLISPMDGIGPEQLNIQSLVQRMESGEVKEIIMALNPTIDGDTTIFYLSKMLAKYELKITSIARGIAFGGELEYVDEITLARSIQSRLPYENYLSK